MATPTYLDELANMLAKVKSQLQWVLVLFFLRAPY